jgi:leader peptidase (prepilin peptidase) / N-methyltransferase
VNYLLSTDFFSVFVFIFGLLFGSFLNVVIYRVPLGLSVVTPRSACPNCKAAIRAYDNVPVLSWIVLRGRCRNCHTTISPRYALVELMCGFLFVAAYYHAAPLDNQFAVLALLKFCVFFFLLLGLIFIDFEHHLLPDVLTIPGFILGLVFSWFLPVGGLPLALTRRLLELRWPLPAVSLVESLIGAALGALFIYGVGELYFRVRHIEGMGFGDVKLMGMVGAFLGAKLTLFTIFSGAILGSFFGVTAMLVVWRKRVARRREHGGSPAWGRSWASARLMLRYYEVPFGVFLGSMAIVSTFVGNRIVDWYLNLYR